MNETRIHLLKAHLPQVALDIDRLRAGPQTPDRVEAANALQQAHDEFSSTDRQWSF
jgi:hypothetical protein